MTRTNLSLYVVEPVILEVVTHRLVVAQLVAADLEEEQVRGHPVGDQASSNLRYNEACWDNKDCFPSAGKNGKCPFSPAGSTLDSPDSFFPTNGAVTWQPNDAAMTLN